ncbi:unnamed protein product [Musa acuminata subsp. burmannicoides]
MAHQGRIAQRKGGTGGEGEEGKLVLASGSRMAMAATSSTESNVPSHTRAPSSRCPDLSRESPTRPLSDATVPHLYRHHRARPELGHTGSLLQHTRKPMIGSQEARREKQSFEVFITNPSPCNRSLSRLKEDLECSDSFLYQ